MLVISPEKLFLFLRYLNFCSDFLAMKFDQLIEYNMRNMFLEKSWTKCGRETRPGTLF